MPVPKKLDHLLSVLQGRIFGDTGQTVPLRWAEGGPGDRARMVAGPHPDWRAVAPDTIWGAPGRFFWFAGDVAVPPDLADRPLALRIEAAFGKVMGRSDPQCLVRLDGRIVQGADANHREIPLPPGPGPHRVLIEAGTIEDRRQIGLALRLMVHDPEAEALYFDLRTPLDVARHLPETDRRRDLIVTTVRDALNAVDFRAGPPERFAASLAAARRIAGRIYDAADTDAAPVITLTGHTHIDVAWLWRVQETRQKMARSMATALSLMARYPDYRFMYNQGYLLAALAEDYPELHDGLLAAQARGQFEVEGALWLEPDANMTSGEALVRHILRGVRHHQRVFGVRPRIVWLPDTFGYSAALPQIMARAGLEVFVTHKMSWNDTNRMPNEIFWWEGIDGTRVPTYFLTTQPMESTSIGTTYCPDLTASHVMGAWRRHSQKDGDGALFAVYGHGDGGGGPTPAMLEHIRRMERGIPGCPRVVHGTMGGFFDALVARMKADPGRYPAWVGELYLEFHRGTFTSVAKVKRNNRRAEAALREVEALASLAMLRADHPWPEADLAALWDIVLLNQFHDILPGSSIGAVYDDSDRDFAAFFDRLDGLRTRLAAALGGSVVANPSGRARGGLVAVAGDGPVTIAGQPGQTLHAPDGTQVQAAPIPPVPPLGAARVAVAPHAAPGLAKTGTGGLSVAPDHLENTHLRARFDDRGRLVSLFCKRTGREALAGPANRITAFRDLPAQFDAWDLDREDQAQSWEVDDLVEAGVVERGPWRAALRLVWRYESSRIVQIVSLGDAGILEFDTCIDWAERNTMLKAAFPLDLRTDRTVAEIQFGHVTRPTHANTSWDSARFEVPKHRWVAMAEPDFGVALTSDCKHGHDAAGSTLRLTLLRAPTWPWDGADIGRHRFRYGLMPFTALSQVPPVAEAFDAPLSLIAPGPAPDSGPALSSIADPGTSGVVPEALKRAEDGDDLILRLVEREGRRQEIALTLAPEIRSWAEADLLEIASGPPAPVTGPVRLCFAPFEIRTLRLGWRPA